MPSPETVAKAMSAMEHRTDAYRYFFEHLDSPDWIIPLQGEGFFVDPPSAVREGEFIRFPIWPESRYLARVANADPGQVLQAIQAIPATDNVRVYEDVADAALLMTREQIITLLPRFIEWLDSPYQLLLPDKVADLSVRLAALGSIDSAISLARKLLELIAVETPAVSGFPPLRHVRGRLDDWRYEGVLQKVGASVGAVDPRALFLFLIELLRTAVDLVTLASVAPNDTSFAWRPSIEDSDQNWDHDFRGQLVRSLRDAALDVASMDSASRDYVLESLEAERWKVFERMALYIIRVLGDSALPAARTRLLRLESGNDPELFHEYWLLARHTFTKLSLDEQLQILSATESPQSDEAPVEADRREQHQLVRLAILTRAVLPPEWQGRFDELAATHSLPEHPSFLVSHGGIRTGPNSPVEPEELLSFSDEQLLTFLSSWQPTGVWMGPSPEGLGRALTQAVTQDPGRFADLAPRLRGHDPTYVRGVLGGFRDAAKGTVSFDWQGVLTLAIWAVQQEPAERGEATDFERDQGWSSARQAVAWMLSQGLEPSLQAVPYALRTNVWEALQPLTLDSNPTQDFESRYGGANMDPLSLSLNTVRGAAFHALISFALWVRRHIEDVPDSAERLSRGFDEMPEVRRVLEDHLDPHLDASPAIRSVYGQAFPFLVLMDSTWARNQVESIFPNTQDDVELWRSAWLGYLSTPNIYNTVVAILIDQYGTAVTRLFDQGDESHEDPAQLSHHLMAMYWRSLIDLNAPTSLLPEFWKRATGKERAEALTFVGLTFSRLTHASEEILNRLIALWEFRTAALTGSTDAEAAEELAAFGWWFASGQFPPEWALQQLTLVLQRTGQAETNHLVLERVAELAPQAPLKCIELLSLLLQPPNDPYGVWAQNEATARTLRAAINSADGVAQQGAIDMIHWLGVRGHLQYRDLLAPSG
jgi:hypothetical protein